MRSARKHKGGVDEPRQENRQQQDDEAPFWMRPREENRQQEEEENLQNRNVNVQRTVIPEADAAPAAAPTHGTYAAWLRAEEAATTRSNRQGGRRRTNKKKRMLRKTRRILRKK